MPRTAPAQELPPRERVSGSLKRFADAGKGDSLFLPRVERHLMRVAQEESDRVPDKVHASEITYSDWCPRSTYLRIRAARDGVKIINGLNAFQLENIFEEGHEYHRKWQQRARDMDALFGMWRCEACRHEWEAISPKFCPACDAYARAISYQEVHLHDDKLLLVGHADGELVFPDVPRDLIEIKSIGEGTVRKDRPELLSAYAHKVPNEYGRQTTVMDYRGVWSALNRPFPAHLKQGLIYLCLRAQRVELPPIDTISFIYEFKPTSSVKEFVVHRDDKLIEPLLEEVSDLVYALDGPGKPPRCINGRTPCKACQNASPEETHDHRDAAQQETGATHHRSRTRAGRAAEARVPVAKTPAAKRRRSAG